MKTKTKSKPRPKPGAKRIRIRPQLAAKEWRAIARLARVCTYIYGDGWQRPLARALDVNERTVRAWIQGRSRLYRDVAREVERLLERKLKRAPAMREIIKRCIADLPAGD